MNKISKQEFFARLCIFLSHGTRYYSDDKFQEFCNEIETRRVEFIDLFQEAELITRIAALHKVSLSDIFDAINEEFGPWYQLDNLVGITLNSFYPCQLDVLKSLDFSDYIDITYQTLAKDRTVSMKWLSQFKESDSSNDDINVFAVYSKLSSFEIITDGIPSSYGKFDKSAARHYRFFFDAMCLGLWPADYMVPEEDEMCS